jgi:membrane protein YdbS with pleckstrin-like domain
MDRLRIAVALAILAGYIVLAFYAASHQNYRYPPGIAIIVPIAVTYLLGGPVVRKIGDLKLTFQPKEESDPDES